MPPILRRVVMLIPPIIMNIPPISDRIVAVVGLSSIDNQSPPQFFPIIEYDVH
jgi:hypothetical protein